MTYETTDEKWGFLHRRQVFERIPKHKQRIDKSLCGISATKTRPEPNTVHLIQ